MEGVFSRINFESHVDFFFGVGGISHNQIHLLSGSNRKRNKEKTRSYNNLRTTNIKIFFTKSTCLNGRKTMDVKHGKWKGFTNSSFF